LAEVHFKQEFYNILSHPNENLAHTLNNCMTDLAAELAKDMRAKRDVESKKKRIAKLREQADQLQEGIRIMTRLQRNMGAI
jgi:uncharacterized protein Yka (UPF0111/DUF47 family)